MAYINITNITPSFFGMATAAATATNSFFFPVTICVIGLIFFMRYLDAGFPLEWVAVVTFFITSTLSTLLAIMSINLVPMWFAQLNMVLFCVLVIWQTVNKTR